MKSHRSFLQTIPEIPQSGHVTFDYVRALFQGLESVTPVQVIHVDFDITARLHISLCYSQDISKKNNSRTRGSAEILKLPTKGCKEHEAIDTSE